MAAARTRTEDTSVIRVGVSTRIKLHRYAAAHGISIAEAADRLIDFGFLEASSVLRPGQEAYIRTAHGYERRTGLDKLPTDEG